MAHDRPPSILQIYREVVCSGGETAYDEVERDAAEICAARRCPNPHLAIESITQPTEVWWLTPYESEAEIEQVAAGYAGNAALRAGLEDIGRRKSDVIVTATNVFAHLRADLSGGPRWRLAGTRFFVAEVAKENESNDGFVFETADGIRFALWLAGSRQQAEEIVAASAPDARVFALRPAWGMPADRWIRDDAEFWSVNPAARRE